MRILICSHEFLPYRGGIAVYTHEIASAAVQLGHEVTVLAPDYFDDQSETDKTRLYKTKRFRGGRFSSRNLISFLYLCRKTAGVSSDYDIVHAADKAFTVGLSFFRKGIRTFFCSTVHGTDVLGYGKSRIVKLLGLKHLYSYPDRIFANSEYTRNLLLTTDSQIDRNKVVTTPLAINDGWFSPLNDCPDDSDIPSGKKIILTVGRLDSRKGHLTVLKALAALPEETRKGICYVIVGGRVKGEELYEKAVDYAAEQAGIAFVKKGIVSDTYLKWIYRKAYLFCMTPESAVDKVEGFGMVYLEAASQKLPAVASNIGGVPEVVLDGKTGFLINNGDSSQLKEYIDLLLNDRTLRDKMGEAAFNHAGMYSWKKTAELTYGKIGK